MTWFFFFCFIIILRTFIYVRKEKYIWLKNRIIFGKWPKLCFRWLWKQQLYYVVEANDIINKARHDLTARELKLMDFVISKIMPDDDKFHVIKTSMYELTKVLNIKQNGKNYADMAKAIGDLRKKKCLFMMKKNELSHKLVGYSLLNIMKMGK